MCTINVKTINIILNLNLATKTVVDDGVGVRGSTLLSNHLCLLKILQVSLIWPPTQFVAWLILSEAFVARDDSFSVRWSLLLLRWDVKYLWPPDTCKRSSCWLVGCFQKHLIRRWVQIISGSLNETVTLSAAEEISKDCNMRTATQQLVLEWTHS